MKKLLAILIVISFYSCKKDNSSNTNYHFSFTADGVNKTFNSFNWAHFDTTGGYIELTILGANGPTSTDNYLGVYLNNDSGQQPIKAGQYFDTDNKTTLLSTYAVNNVESESGQSMAIEASNYNVPITNHFKLNITSMDKTTVKGTFSGDYYQDGDVRNGKKITITNGDFYVKFR